jgi:hypothetical protein
VAVWAAATCGHNRASVQAARTQNRRRVILYAADPCGRQQPAKPGTARVEFLELGILAKHYDC